MRIKSHTKTEFCVLNGGFEEFRRKRGIDFLENLSRSQNQMICVSDLGILRLLKGLNLLTFILYQNY